MAQVRLQSNGTGNLRPTRKKRPLRMRAVRPSRRLVREFRKQILASSRGMYADVKGMAEWLDGTATPAEAARVLREMQERWREKYGAQATDLGMRMAHAVDEDTRRQLQANLAKSLSVDVAEIFDDEAVRQTAETMGIEAAALIRDVPLDFLEEVHRATLRHAQQLPQPEGRTLTEQIRELIGGSERRANTIARDQVSKITTAVNQQRQQSIGIEEYTWRTAEDIRVAGNPAGPNAKAKADDPVHGNHYKRNGKKFRWDKPPPDGHPGYALNCRCYAEPVIDWDNLKDVA